jgi:branched-chain amino acid transport system permease protein
MLYRETGQFQTTYRTDMQMLRIRQDRIALYALLAFAFLVVPALAHFQVGWFGNDYIFKAILIPFLILSLAAIGLNILTGYCGQISLGGAAFMAIGAYAAYNFSLRVPGMPVLLSILLGGGVAALVGIMFGIPSLRIKGLYLAVATLAAQFFFDWLFIRVKWFTNYTPSGSVTAPDLNFFGWLVNTPVERYLIALSFVTVFALVAKNLVRGSIGRQWMAIRDMDIAAEIMGIRPLYAKLTAFAISSFFCGLAGALWAFVHLGAWEPLAFNIDRSNQLLFMIIIGGLGSILGSFLGAGFILLLPIMLDQAPRLMGIVFGLAFLGIMLMAIRSQLPAKSSETARNIAALAIGGTLLVGLYTTLNVWGTKDWVFGLSCLGVVLSLFARNSGKAWLGPIAQALLAGAMVGLLWWTSKTFFSGPVSVEVVSHLVFIITGSLICALLIVEPHGFARLWALAKEKLRLWPFPY